MKTTFLLSLGTAALAIVVEDGKAGLFHHQPGNTPDQAMTPLGECSVEHLAFVTSDVAHTLTSGYSEAQRHMLDAMISDMGGGYKMSRPTDTELPSAPKP